MQPSFAEGLPEHRSNRSSRLKLAINPLRRAQTTIKSVFFQTFSVGTG
jgi:hypothetical protein